MKTSLSFLWEYRRPYLLLLGVLVGAAVLEGLAIAALYPLLNVVLGTGDAPAAGPILGALAALVLAFPPEQRVVAALALFLAVVPTNSAMKLLREWLQAWTSGRVTYDVKRRVFERLRNSPYAYFLAKSQGDLAYRLSVAPQNLALALLLAATIVSYALSSLATIGLLLSIEWRVTLAMLLLGAGFFRANRYVARQFSVNAGREKLAAQSAELGVVQEFVAGAKEILVAGAGGAWLRRFTRQSDVYRRFFVRDLAWSATPGLLLELMVFVMAGVVAAGLRLLAADAVLALLSVLTIFVYAVRQLLGMLGVISRQALRFAALSPDVTLLRTALTEPHHHVREGARTDLAGWRQIRFEDVTFLYAGRGETVLRRASFAIERGRTTAIVGASGVGKTTVLYLLLRLFDPSSGRILLDSTELAEFRRSEWLARIGYVSQECFVFNGTVAENIAFGEDRSSGEIERAARAAHADEFVRNLPDGYATALGDRGLSLSAGQRQRLVIARALVRDPELLLLDEATSALDSVSERLVQEALAEVARRCTVVVVAHRISTVRRADRILVLERGRVVEQGRHADLLAEGGVYARLARTFEDERTAAV